MKSVSQFIEFLTQFCLLVGKLPPQGGKPTAVSCDNCGAWSGLVANRAGILMGTFEPDILNENGIVSISTVLTHAVLIDERRVSLKCMDCGYVTRWRR
ncbi:MAG TPA: hypothetical protein VK395_23395 [Gemmataceae bacterium]|nr:hypothetical protein [Gemmataceae bacterium]